MRRSWSAAGVGAPLVLAYACTAGTLDRPEGGGGIPSIATESDGGVSSVPGGAGPGRGAAPAGGGGGGSSAAPGGAPATCVTGSDGSGLPPADVAPPNVVPTRTPFTCATLPETFIFPPATLNPPRAYARCASFSIGAASSVSLSPDGRLAVLATGDGIGRVVELATRQVVAVLASPRAMIDRVAFAPDGGAILTLASAQREVTLWRTGDWTGVTRVWTAELPGPRYDVQFGGGLAFAPDGQSAIASPGTGVFLLDVASGKLRQSALTGAAILDVAYGLNGTRVVVAVASLLAHCIHTPNGGQVALLNGDLQGVTTLADLGTYPGQRGVPAFRVSPTDDLVLVAPALDEPPGLHAFQLSDGAAVAAPAFEVLPLAFMPDGASVLFLSGGALQRVGFPDGQMISVAMLGDGGPVSISPDGKVVAMGGVGTNLLRTWNPAPDAFRPLTSVCSADDSGPPAPVSSLSAHGQLLAAGVGKDLRVFRRADGARLMSLPMGTALTSATRIQISPRGGYVAVAPAWSASSTVFAIPNGAAVATFSPETSGWLDFLFTPADDKLYTLGKRSDVYGLMTIGLGAPGGSASRAVPAYSTLLGFSGGCPVMYASNVGAWRSCGACDDSPVPAAVPGLGLLGPAGAVLSGDGMFVAAAGAFNGPGVSLWRLRPDPTLLLTIPHRGGSADWSPQEYPVAITPGATRILTGAFLVQSCYGGPQYEVMVRDTTPAATVIDALPPGITSVDATVRTIAYGTQLWCAQ